MDRKIEILCFMLFFPNAKQIPKARRLRRLHQSIPKMIMVICADTVKKIILRHSRHIGSVGSSEVPT